MNFVFRWIGAPNSMALGLWWNHWPGGFAFFINVIFFQVGITVTPTIEQLEALNHDV